MDREKENKRRARKGLGNLPEDTLDSDVREMMVKIMQEIEEKKQHQERMESSQKKREREEFEFVKEKEEYEKQQNKEWESYRDKRVKNWNKFRDKIMNGKTKGKYEIKPPLYKMEEREKLDEKAKYKSLGQEKKFI